MKWSLITRPDIEVNLIQARTNTELNRFSKNSVNRAQFTEALILIARNLFSWMKRHTSIRSKQNLEDFSEINLQMALQ